jgi:hypothetical protein
MSHAMPNWTHPQRRMQNPVNSRGSLRNAALVYSTANDSNGLVPLAATS